MRALFGVVAALTAATLQTAVEAAEYPARPIRMIVPYAPGGASDFFARVLAERFTAAWGQQVVVDNRLRHRGQGQSGRLYDAARHLGLERRQSEPLYEDAVRREARSRADRNGGIDLEHTRRAHRSSREVGAGHHSHGESESGEGDLRLIGRRERAASLRRAAQDRHRHQYRARAVQGHGAEHDRSAGRADRHGVFEPAARRALRAGRQDARARDHDGGACAIAAQRADDDRGRRAQLRRRRRAPWSRRSTAKCSGY